MEFMNKRDRLVLTTISQTGPAGIELSALISSLSPIMTKESIMKSVEELLIRDLIKLANLGQGEIRYIASKEVRDAMINLEINKLKVAEYIKDLNTKKDEILQIQDKTKQIEELKRTVTDGMLVISSGVLSLMHSMPELTVAEYIEAIQPIIEVLEKLYKIIEKPYTKEETDAILKIIEKYRGERDSRVLKSIIEKSEVPQKQKES